MKQFYFPEKAPGGWFRVMRHVGPGLEEVALDFLRTAGEAGVLAMSYNISGFGL